MYLVNECSAAEFMQAASDLVESITLGECFNCGKSAVLEPETEQCATCFASLNRNQ